MVAHRHLVQVRSTDLDWLGHVNNTAFPVFFQEARVALQHGWRGGLRHDEVDTVMARLEVDHLRQLHLRAEPVAALYEQVRVAHARGLSALEAQMMKMARTGWQGQGSPDRLDALVWALTELMVDPTGKLGRPGLRTL